MNTLITIRGKYALSRIYMMLCKVSLYLQKEAKTYEYFNIVMWHLLEINFCVLHQFVKNQNYHDDRHTQR